MRISPPASVRRALVATLSMTACAVLLGASASADPAPPVTPDPGNSAVVSRLSISDGKGWLTLHLRNSTATGFEVRVPAGDGSWSGKADVYLPEEDAHCQLQAGPDLHYVCSPGEYGFPNGGFAVSIPVTRTGSVAGLTGDAWAVEAGGQGYQDTFPVLDGSHYRSTAEVRAVPVVRDQAETAGRANLSITTTVVPRDTITALDVTLPPGHWRIMGTNAPHHGTRCAVVGSGTDAPTVHCRPAAPAGDAFAPGRFNLVLILGLDGRPEQTYSEVSLTASGLSPEAVDTFPWVAP